RFARDWSSDVCSSDLDRIDLLIKHGPDLGESQTQFAQEQDALQAQQAGAVVEPLPAVPDPARCEQTHLLVVAQRAARDTGAAHEIGRASGRARAAESG